MTFRWWAWLPLLLPLLVLACGDDGTRSRQEGVIPSEKLPAPPTPRVPEEEFLASMILTPQEVSEVLPGPAWTEGGVVLLGEMGDELPPGAVAFWGEVVAGDGEVTMALSLYETADAAMEGFEEGLRVEPGPGVEIERFDATGIGDEAHGQGNRTPEVFTVVFLRIDRVVADIVWAAAGGERSEEIRLLAQRLAEKIEAGIES